MTPNPNLPVGSIVMFYGDIDHLPIGWEYCDGTSGTPDLRDLFIVGAGRTYNLGASGGQNTVTLTTDQIPAHSHKYQQFNLVNIDWKSGGDLSPMNGTGSNLPGITESTGGGMPHENRPPFYALFYIMKVS
ncbi:MAG: phage tail protein [Bacteroidetes bacterium]|nr:phage tail protein [Bacteroidota bacterium]